jgi:hypothetical protein
MALSCERFPASCEFTSKGLLSRVNPHVGLQIAVLCEAFAAYLTRERLLACVSTLMYLQTTRSGILLTAHIAFVGLLTSVDENVRLQVTLGDETLAAPFEGALEWPVSSVGSHVSLEVTCFVEVP